MRRILSLGLALSSVIPAVRAEPLPIRVDPIIAAAGDIACDPANPKFNGGAGTAGACRQRATSKLLVDGAYSAVLPLGDIQYEDGTLPKFQAVYAPTWGRVKSVTRPAVGGHEYLTAGAAGYYDYFGWRAGNRSRGYYSYDVGSWHLIALNAVCGQVGGCGPGSPQERWLRNDLAANDALCTLAYWHNPRFSSGMHGSDPVYDAFWRALYDAGADVVLVGHDHHYERFAKQTPDASPDVVNGIRQFVVGTGGRSHYQIVTVAPNSEVRNTTTFGVLELTLHAASYDWRFVPIAGQTFTDAGSDVCW